MSYLSKAFGVIYDQQPFQLTLQEQGHHHIFANAFNKGKYKLKQIGRAFTYNYLKRVRINTCKYSDQIKRIFGADRLGIVSDENKKILKKLLTK